MSTFRSSTGLGATTLGLCALALALTAVAAWLTHVVVAISGFISGVITTGYAVLLIMGVLVPPVGVIHGVGVWFGAW